MNEAFEDGRFAHYLTPHVHMLPLVSEEVSLVQFLWFFSLGWEMEVKTDLRLDPEGQK